MDQSNRDHVAGTSTSVAINDPTSNPPPCFKLLVDCWEHIFDYLSFKDIHAMGGTCKPMNRLAGHYFSDFFPNLDYELKKGEIRGTTTFDFNLRPDFYQFVRRVEISSRRELDYVFDAETFPLLKMFIFTSVNLIKTQLDFAQNVLRNIEIIELIGCKVDGKIFNQLANDCPKLKYLNINSCRMEVATINEFLKQHYPQLKYMRFIYKGKRIMELKTFLKKHSNLKCFMTDFGFLWANRNLLKETNVQLDMLEFDVDDTTIPFDGFVDFMKVLYERGFYKALHLSCGNIWGDLDVNFCNAVYRLPTLDKLSLVANSDIDLSRLTNLNELFVLSMHQCSVADLENIAKSLSHLKRLVFGEASIDVMFPFIRHSKRLNEFLVDDVLDSEFLDLFVFNEERKKLADASQISIGVNEDIYLANKWNTRNSNLSHVKITRFDRLMGTATNLA